MKGLLSNERLGIKLLTFSFLFFLGLIIGTLITYIVFGNDESSIDAIRWGQFIVSLFAFAFPAVSCAFLFSRENTSFFNLTKFPSFQLLAIGCLSFLLILPFINLLAWLNMQVEFPAALSGIETELHRLEDAANAIVEKVLSLTSTKDLLLNLFFVALVPAVTEELIFRGTLQKMLGERFNSHAAVWITAIVFSAFHMQFFGFIPRIVLGALLGYFYVWSGSLYLPMVAHFINNALGVWAGWLVANKHISADVENIGGSSQFIIGLVCLALVIPLLIYMERKGKKNNLLIETKNNPFE